MHKYDYIEIIFFSESTYDPTEATACTFLRSQSRLLIFILVRGGVVPYSSKRDAKSSMGGETNSSSSG